MSAEFAAAVRAAHAGTINFNRFAATSMPKWRAIAREFYQSWVLPAWVGVEDVLQELLLAAWKAIREYDASRDVNGAGASIDRFVEWRARKALSRAMAKASGLTLHRPAKAPAWFRVEQSVDSDSPILLNAAEEPEQERAIDEPRERAHRFAVLDDLAENPRQRVALHLIEEYGSLEEAARAINGSVDARLAFKVSTLEEARGALQSSIAGLQRKFGIEEATA